MDSWRPDRWSRREFVGGVTLASAGLLGLTAEPAAAEPPPETKRIRLVRIPSICRAPQYVGEDLLRGEGFTDVEYVGKAGGGEIGRASCRERV